MRERAWVWGWVVVGLLVAFYFSERVADRFGNYPRPDYCEATTDKHDGRRLAPEGTAVENKDRAPQKENAGPEGANCVQWRAAVGAEQQARYTRYGLWVVGVTFGAAVFAAVAAWRTVWTMQDTAKRELRPYVHVRTVDLNRVFDTETGALIVIEIHVVWTNCGKTPTRRLNSGIQWRLFEGGLPPDFDFPPGNNPNAARHAAIGPGQEFRTVMVIPRENFDRARGRTHTLYYWAWIEYGEALQPLSRFRTETCSRIDVYTDPGVERPHFALTLHTNFNGADEDCHHQPSAA